MVSVVINIYNGEKYIEKCVQSILNQTFADFELIIVDDGSNDNTAQIIDNIAFSDKRIRVYHTMNKGLSGSRKYGLSLMYGQYGIFLDCDDWVESDWLELLFIAVTRENADLAICEYYEEYDYTNKHIEITEQDDVIDYTRDLIHGRTWCVVWNKLFKVDIVRKYGIDFEPNARYWEDVPFSISYSLYCNKIAYVHKPLYHYVKTNTGSLTATEGTNISYNVNRVHQVQLIEPHLVLSGKDKVLRDDMSWIKFWIKDAFVRSKIDAERIRLWRESFSEVNSEYKLHSSSLFTYALVHHHDWYIYLHYYYYELRHFIKRLIHA